MSRDYYCEELVTNITTALMAIRDIATFNEIPINIHVDDHWIHVIVGFGTPMQKKRSWYTQDLYSRFSKEDAICDWIKKTAEEFKESK